MHLELFPKILDSLDSGWFALRMWLAGRVAMNWFQALTGLAVGSALAVSPEARTLLIAAIMTFCAAEALHRLTCAVPPLQRLARAR